MSEHDEFTGIFDDLTPDDFAVRAVAAFGVPRESGKTFDDFVDTHLKALRVAFMAASGNIQPVAHLMTADTEWMFTPEDEETLGHFVDRLQNEARRLGATWVFLSRRTLVGTWQDSPDKTIDTTSPEAIQAAIEAGAYREGVFYFGQTSDGEPRVRHGIIYIEGDNLGEPIEADSRQGANFFARILGES